MKRFLAATALTAALVLPHGVRAQSAQRLSIQVSGIGNLLFGELTTSQGLFFGAPGNGYGGEAQLRYTPSAFSLGVGFQIARHEAGKAPSSYWDFEDSSQHFTLTGLFVEPRYVVKATSQRALYVSGRLAFSSIKWTSEGTGTLCNDQFCNSTTVVDFSDSGDATGFTVNAGGGFLFRLSERVNLDVGATFGLKSFGDLEVTLADETGPNRTQQTGSLGSIGNVVLRLGLAIGLGG